MYFKWKVIKPDYVIKKSPVQCRNLLFVELSLKSLCDFFFSCRVFHVPWLLRNFLWQCTFISPFQQNSEFLLGRVPSALWVNGFLVSVQPLHRVLVCGPIAFVPCLGLFPYAFFFFLRLILFKFWNQQKKKKISPWERLKVFTLGTANLFFFFLSNFDLVI